MEEEPMSAEEFTRRHRALMDAIGCTVRRELEVFRANGDNSANVQRPFDVCKISFNDPLIFGDALDRIGEGDNCFVRIPSHRGELRILRGIDRFSVHALSLLMAGGFILASLAIVGKFNKKQ